MYDQNWYNSGDIVPDQVTPASDATPLVDSETGVTGTSTEYSRGDHQHPLQVSTVLPAKYTATGDEGAASTYARSDHQHPIQTVDTIPVSDSADGSYGTVESYTRNDHSHPINVETNASIIPIVDGVGNNGTSAYYSRHDHIHLQQLTYDSNVTATKFIKTGGTNQQILLADGQNKAIINFNTSVAPRAYQIDPADGIYWMCFAILNISKFTSNYVLNAGASTSFAGVTSGTIYINPMSVNFVGGLRISKTVQRTGSAAIQLGCSRTVNTVQIAGQWAIYTSPSNYVNNPLGFIIVLASEASDNTRGLRISVDRNTFRFNGRVL
ncbi:MAG: hypothetical protein EZS28_004054 [Streblomastix strix]|uniref:Uncharacterized protein n=1 Tax=Streblomastix strix TaxID=222440 RepID=A0A5J4X0Y4_9EUKA|nr:MAG: hypothetical protein EZS28_004054 [Streblomastix strix]